MLAFVPRRCPSLGAALWTAALWAALPGAIRPAGAQSVIKTAPLASFDGRTWAGLTIGTTTRDAMKKAFKTRGSRGDDKFLRSEALILVPPEGPGDPAEGDIKALQAM